MSKKHAIVELVLINYVDVENIILQRLNIIATGLKLNFKVNPVLLRKVVK